MLVLFNINPTSSMSSLSKKTTNLNTSTLTLQSHKNIELKPINKDNKYFPVRQLLYSVIVSLFLFK